MIRALVVVLALWFSQAHAYLGSFDPQPLRNFATITFYDDQFPGPRCASLSSTIGDALFIPLTLQAVGCAYYNKSIVVVPISFGLGWLYGLQVLATPNGNLGHETRHIFDGAFHSALLSFTERVRKPNYQADRVLADQQYRNALSEIRRSGKKQLRVPTKDETVCTIFVTAEDVSYEDFGALVRECLK